jgi:RimJ/RimL family protein N-acetyltransferase
MSSSTKYLFQSARLGFRNWQAEDVPVMADFNADPEVMEFFPAPATLEQTAYFVVRMQQLFAERGHCFFPAFRLADDQLIGFIGLGYQDFAASFTPCADIGWRLGKAYWGQGYATEGAKRCLEYAFDELGLTNVKSIASVVNVKSIRVMEKIGMQKQLYFQHPKLVDYPRIVDCVCYEIGGGFDSIWC